MATTHRQYRDLLVVLASRRQGETEEFAEAIEKGQGVSLLRAGTAEAVPEIVAGQAPSLVVIDEELTGEAGLRALVMRIVSTNAMTNTAVLSSRDRKTVLDELEGFGVLDVLAIKPTRDHARELLQRLREIA